jgi:hypothetical protein
MKPMSSIRSIITMTFILCKISSAIEVVDAQQKQPQGTREERPTTARSQPVSNPGEDLNRLIVMVRCQIAERDSFGAGIIFGASTDRLYFATANHVVREGMDQAQSVLVQLKWMPGEWKTAQLLDNKDQDADLAVLAINLSSQGMHVDRFLRWDLLGDVGSLKSGDSVYSIGFPNGEAWRSFVTPDKVYQKSLTSILFESNFVSPGNSGGALVNDRRELVGMIRDTGKAVSIQSILDTLRQWGYPVGLQQSQQGSNPPADPSSSSKSLLGTWKYESRGTTPINMSITFTGDGTAVFSSLGKFKVIQKYVFDGVTLKTEIVSGPEADSEMKVGDIDIYTVKLEGNTMTWRESQTGLVMVWTREH